MRHNAIPQISSHSWNWLANFFGCQEIGHHCYRLQLPPWTVLPCKTHLHRLVLPLMTQLQFPQPLPFLSTPWNLPPSIHHLSFLSCTLLQQHHQHQTPKRQQFQTLTLKLFLDCKISSKLLGPISLMAHTEDDSYSPAITSLQPSLPAQHSQKKSLALISSPFQNLPLLAKIFKRKLTSLLESLILNDPNPLLNSKLFSLSLSLSLGFSFPRHYLISSSCLHSTAVAGQTEGPGRTPSPKKIRLNRERRHSWSAIGAIQREQGGDRGRQK
jgi:hypothetical protein